jgi:hypothetical protein
MDSMNLTGPQPEDDEGVDEGGDHEYEVIVQDVARLEGEHEQRRQGIK